MVEWTRKTLIKKFPQMNMSLQTQINALKARKGGRAKEGWKIQQFENSWRYPVAWELEGN